MTAAVAALVRERGGSVALSAIDLRAPGPDEVRVRIMASGVCATDLFGIAGGAGDRFPAVFGHEGAGIVEAGGEAVTGLAPGDHVVLSFDSCGTCDACRAGHPAYCARFAALNYAPRSDAAVDGEGATTGWMSQSSWSTHVVARESNAVRIDDDVPWAVAAPLGCGVLTGVGTVVNVLRPGVDDALLVIGAGTTGLAAIMAARHRGIRRIVVVDPSAERRALAQDLGAHETLEPAAFEPAATVGGLGSTFTHALDTVGTPDTTERALDSLAPRGVCATVALKPGANPVQISQSHLLWGRTLTGVIEGDADVQRDIPMLTALWRAGRLPVERLVTTYAFDDISAAVDDARAGRSIKPVVLMPADAHTSLEAGPVATAGAAASSAPAPLSAIRDRDLPHLWRTLPAVQPGELIGLWRGTGLSLAHPVQRRLERSDWFGKLFRSESDVAPIVCTDADGSLVEDRRLAGGGATVRTLRHEGVDTAAMLYDATAVVDLFTRLGPDTLLGVMTGPGTLHEGRAYYFLLEREPDREVRAG